MIRTLVALTILGACSASADAQPEAQAAQSFRPLSALFFLPEYVPTPAGEVALVPNSKIAWDLQVVTKSLGLSDVEITVHDQVVRLRGTVPSADARETLLRVTRRAHGVRKVIDTLEVRP